MPLVMKVPIALLLIVSLLSMSGCGPISTATTMLETILTAAEAILPIIAPLAGVDPALAATISKWLQLVSDDVGKATAVIQNTTLTTLQKSAQITEIFANVALVVPGLPPEVSILVQAVVAAVNAFVGQFGTPKALSAKYGAAVHQPLKLEKGDKAALADINKRALALKTAAAKAVAK